MAGTDLDIVDQKEAKLVLAALDCFLRYRYDLARSGVFRSNPAQLNYSITTAERLRRRISDNWQTSFRLISRTITG